MDRRLKARVRLELFLCAREGTFPTYEDFYERVQGKEMMGQFPLQTHFKEIAEEERRLGYPDITYIVRRKDPKYPYPSQIDFRSATPMPDVAQLTNLISGPDEIISLYCPESTTNPYRSE